MARADAIGFFWEDRPTVKPPKVEKIKRTPPKPTWLDPSYLPGLEEALAFNIPQFTDGELFEASQDEARGEGRHQLVYDIECYPNYFLAAFRSVKTGKVTYVEMTDTTELNVLKLKWLMENFCTVGFNSISYDLPITALACAGKNCAQLKQATNDIISLGMQGKDVLRSHKVKKLKVDHIDLIEVAPLSASLKIYGGRIHTRRMQDLPFHPDTILSPEQIAIVRWYCINDLLTTEDLRVCLKEQLSLRESMSVEYGVDLRSKSDAQIAEAVISEEVGRLNGARPQRPEVAPGTRYRYNIPSFLQYQTPLMNYVLDVVRNTDFIVSEYGNVGMPKELADLKVHIADSVYRMGIGGLHSSEQKAAHVASKDFMLMDVDVTSFYPQIILNQGLFPKHLGSNFLHVYQQIVTRRVRAKNDGDKVIADSLKIVVNGSFGKLGSMYSVLYSPDLLIQVTITGQLSLLMLIERLELAGISVVSANTDGIVIKCATERRAEAVAIIKRWEQDTNFQMEETRYHALYSRDVNNYIAVKLKQDKSTGAWIIDGAKTKGAYANPWGSSKNPADRLHKNPTSQICVEAAIQLLTKQTPVEQTILGCTDIKQFISVRAVAGGAVKDGNFLGKSVRWYYATEQGDSEIVYAKSGNKVPRSEGAQPLMDLPAQLPADIDYDWYIKETEKILQEIGYAT